MLFTEFYDAAVAFLPEKDAENLKNIINLLKVQVLAEPDADYFLNGELEDNRAFIKSLEKDCESIENN